jgi:Taurine catabolism dioxygenase TauD, TfdA family
MLPLLLGSILAMSSFNPSDFPEKMIKKVYQQTLKEGDASEVEDSQKTLLFLGTSENDIHTVIFSTENGEWCQISADGTTAVHSDLPEMIDSPFQVLSKVNVSALKMPSQNLRISTELPFSADDSMETYYVNQEKLPFVISPKTRQMTLSDFQDWAKTHRAELQHVLHTQGAILMRGLPVSQPEDFATVVKAVLNKELIDYKGEGSRRRIVQGVYTSTEAPPEFKIPLHNEFSCTVNPVDYICFYCEIAPKPGTGQTLLGRTEDVTEHLKKTPTAWNLFENKTIKYISRHPPDGNFFARVNPTHKTWPQAFETTDREEVERICARKGYSFRWQGDWIEVTRYVPALLGPDAYFDHPYWFNQAHLYHANPRIRGGSMNHLLANLLYLIPSTRQYDVEFEDGSPITKEAVYEIYDVLDANTILFDWEKGDVLILDNRRTLHGRAPSSGSRKILTTMIQ